MKKFGWVFTLNNYAEGEIPLYRTDAVFKWVPKWDHPNLAYLGFGREVASSTGTPHLQGMVVFTRSVGMRTLKQLNERAHWQPMRGSFEEAQKYCSKVNYYEWLQPGITKKFLKEKVEEDHLRAKVIQDENDNIQALSKALYNQSKDVAELQAAVKELVLLNKYILKKLNTCLTDDKFV